MKIAAAGLLLLLGFQVYASGIRLDDSASPRQRFDVAPRWVPLEEDTATADRLNRMVAQVANVEVRLNTAKWVGKGGRIYLVLPPMVSGLGSPQGMRVEWTTRGTFLAGAALPGDRVLIYDGPIQRPLLSEIFDFAIQLDARHMVGGLRFDPHFEIEPAP